jgi:four helix bundle protein
MEKAAIFRNLKCWQAVRRLVQTVHAVSECEKLSEKYFLKSELKRKAVMAMSTIAEGFDKTSNDEFIFYLNSSLRSVAEIKCMSQLLADQEFITTQNINVMVRHIANDTHTHTEDLISFLQDNN